MEEVSSIDLEENVKQTSETGSVTTTNTASTRILNTQSQSDPSIVDQKWRADQTSSINSSGMELNVEKTTKTDSITELSRRKVTKYTDTDEHKKSDQPVFDNIVHEDSTYSQSFVRTSNKMLQNDTTCIQHVGSDIESSLLNSETLSQTNYNKMQFGGTYKVGNSDLTGSNEESKMRNVSTIYLNAKREISYEEVSEIQDKHPEETTYQLPSTELINKNTVKFIESDLQIILDNDSETCEKNKTSTYQDLKLLQGHNRVTATSEIKLKPFNLHWSFGYNKTGPVLNLTKKDHIIAFVDSQAGVLFNYHDKTMMFLQGHYNSIVCMATDQSGNWVVTADEGDDSAVIVWDTNNYVPIYTLFGPHTRGTKLVGISPNARYLVTVSPWPDQIVQLWLWTLGTDKAEASLELSEEYGNVQRLTFSSDISEYVMLTTKTHVLFISFEGKQLKLHEPLCNLASRQSCFFTDSVYVTNTHIAVTATSTGHIYEWSDVPYQDSYTVFLLNNNKELLNYKKLQNEAITHISSVDNHVVTVTISGLISFYDKRLCLLYWISNFGNEHIVSISFSLLPQSSLTSDHCPHRKQNECSTTWEAVHIVHSDATLEKKPFHVRNFIVSTLSGKILHINYSRKKVEKLVTCSDSPLTAIDTYPNNHFICTGNASGTCILFDTKQKKAVITQKINSTASEKIEISCLKYSYNGSVLACGMSDGSLWLLDPLLLKPKPDMPISNSTDPIIKIVFSFNSMYLAHADGSFCVTLYLLEEKGIKMLSKYKAHYKPIKDIVFASNEDFYSIAEDRFVIHYNIYRPDDVHVSPVTRIEQSAVPLSMCLYPNIDDTEQKLLISNSEFKYKLLKMKPAVKCCKTAQAPVTSTPVSCMMVLQQRENKKNRYIVFHCDRHLGIQILPVDGNPFKYITTVTSSKKINNMCLSVCGNFIFTTSKDGYNLTMWQINTLAVDVMEEIGGEGLKPYYHLLEGGQDGCLFYQMQQFFYLGKLLHQGDYPSIYHSVSNKLPMCDLPDVLRGIGYFPSEFELQNIITEVSSSTRSDSDIREVQFDDFVRLYINHRPTPGISAQKIKNSFLVFAHKPDDNCEPYIHKSHLLNILKYNGERLPHAQASTYLWTLTEKGRAGIKDTQHECSGTECKDCFLYAHEKITFEDFLYDILGYSEEETKVGDNVQNDHKNV